MMPMSVWKPLAGLLIAGLMGCGQSPEGEVRKLLKQHQTAVAQAASCEEFASYLKKNDPDMMGVSCELHEQGWEHWQGVVGEEYDRMLGGQFSVHEGGELVKVRHLWQYSAHIGDPYLTTTFLHDPARGWVRKLRPKSGHPLDSPPAATPQN